MKPWFSEFWIGCTRPSALALVVLLLTVGAGLLAAQAVVTPEWLSEGGYRFLMKHKGDQGPYTTARALALKSTSTERSDTAVVAVICASATMASISSPEKLAVETSRRLGRPVNVYLLCLDGMTPWEMMALADQTPVGQNVIVIVDIGLNRFSRSGEDVERTLRAGRLGLRSARAEEEARRTGAAPLPRLGIYLFDNAGFFSGRFAALAKRIVSGPVEFRMNDRFAPTRTLDDARYAWQVERVRGLQARFDETSDENLAVLARTVELVRARGAHVAFVETPVNPKFLREEVDSAMYGAQMRKLVTYADGIHVPVWKPATEARFAESDFVDWTHVRSPEARERYTAALGAMAAQALRSGS